MAIGQLYPKSKYRAGASFMPPPYPETEYVNIGRTTYFVPPIIFGLLSLGEVFVPVYNWPQKSTTHSGENLSLGQMIESMDYTC